jgi:hypothetical protein
MEVFMTGSLPAMEDQAAGDQADASKEEDPYDIY